MEPSAFGTNPVSGVISCPISVVVMLEGKLDSIVSLLGQDQGLTNSRPGVNISAPASSFHSPTSAGATTTIPASLASPYSADELSPEDADKYLANFRNHMLKYFAFLHLPTDMKTLQHDRPFLYLCIIAVSCQSTHKKIVLGARIKQILAQRVFLDDDPLPVSIDLLLGLLTYIAWGHDYLLHGNTASLSRFTQLAMTLVFDLRLNKPVPDETNMLPIDRPNGYGEREGGSVRSMEEIRAVLGCFVMSSMFVPPLTPDFCRIKTLTWPGVSSVSAYFAQIDALQWTSHMEECLTTLSQSKESPYDEMFAHQVLLQKIAGEVEGTKGTISTTPPSFYLTAFRTKLDLVKADFSSGLQHDKLSVFGLMLSSSKEPDFKRTEYLYACLKTAKSGIDDFFKTPLREYSATSFLFFVQLARFILVLIKLSTMNDPSWDTKLARSTVDILQVMDELISNVRHARAAEGEICAEGLLDRAAKIFVAVKAACAGKFAEKARNAETGNSECETAGEDGLLLDPFILEDAWLNDISSVKLVRAVRDQFQIGPKDIQKRLERFEDLIPSYGTSETRKRCKHQKLQRSSTAARFTQPNSNQKLEAIFFKSKGSLGKKAQKAIAGVIREEDITKYFDTFDAKLTPLSLLVYGVNLRVSIQCRKIYAHNAQKFLKDLFITDSSLDRANLTTAKGDVTVNSGSRAAQEWGKRCFPSTSWSISKKASATWTVVHTETLCTVLTTPWLDVNQKDDDGVAPLHYAASSLVIEPMQILLKQSSVDTQLCSETGDSISDIVLRRGAAAVVKLLPTRYTAYCNKYSLDWEEQDKLELPINELERCHGEGATLLYFAVQGDNLDELESLYESRSFDVNALDNQQKTPLH
ncbi:hypothetical protein G7046_g2655 [Stylonectria norvegica]|nr:hypothetical protein G7046_g2655 [Stylonectria norvegica]